MSRSTRHDEAVRPPDGRLAAGPGTTAPPRPRDGAPPLVVRHRRHPKVPYLPARPVARDPALALGYPLVWQIVTSTKQFGLKQQFGAPAEFVGLQNYAKLVTDPYLWEVIVRSIVFCVVVRGRHMLLGVGIALLMKNVHKPVRLIPADHAAAGLGDAGRRVDDRLALAVRLPPTAPSTTSLTAARLRLRRPQLAR